VVEPGPTCSQDARNPQVTARLFGRSTQRCSAAADGNILAMPTSKRPHPRRRAPCRCVPAVAASRSRFIIGLISAGDHARRSWLPASLRLRRSLAFGSGRRPPWTPSSTLDSVHSGSFSLRSGAHVAIYAQGEATAAVAWSSRKPRQKPGLASVELTTETNGQSKP
jgi:hypothetical protein